MQELPELSIQFYADDPDLNIRPAIEAALSVSDDVEVFLTDDASRGGFSSLAHEIGEKDRRFEYHHFGKRVGEAAARNFALKNTDADYVLIAWPEDILDPEGVLILLDFLKKNESYAGAYGKDLYVDLGGKPGHHVTGHTFSRFMLPYDEAFDPGVMLVRREDVMDAGLFMETGDDEDSSEVEKYLYYRLAAVKDIKYINAFTSQRQRRSRQHINAALEKSHEVFEFIRDETFSKWDHLVERLREEPSAPVKANDIKAAVLMLSLLSTEIGLENPEHLDYLNAAERLDPFDYGILLRKYFFHSVNGDVYSAAEVCSSILEKFGNDPLVRMNALRLKMHISELYLTSEEEQAVRNEISAIENDYFKLTGQLAGKFGK